MTRYKSYKYLIKPTNEQKIIIDEILNGVKIVHNEYVKECFEGINMNRKAINIIAKYKHKYESLNNVDGSALVNAIFNLQNKKIMQRTIKRCVSYTTSNLKKQPIYMIDDNNIFIPKLGSVNVVYHRPIPNNNRIMKVTISITNTNKYYVSVGTSYEQEVVYNNIDQEKIIGIDYSSTHFYVDHMGNKIDMPHYYRDEEEKIRKINRKLSRCQKGSSNYKKLNEKLKKKYQKIVNQRKDFLHKLSTKLVNEYDIIAIETLDLNEIANSKYNLVKATYDNSFGAFELMLEYKTREKGKKLIKVDKYYPSSKTCRFCGYVNGNLKLSDRNWICPKCKTLLDRDLNSAINIRNEGLRIYNSIGYLDNACKKQEVYHANF